MKLEHLAQALAKTENELRQERASALGRAAQVLEGLLTQLETLRQAYGTIPVEERAAHIAEYTRVREQARYRYWCLLVQREAIGLRDHRELESAYRVPPPLAPLPVPALPA
jgi:hypothetical protein